MSVFLRSAIALAVCVAGSSAAHAQAGDQGAVQAVLQQQPGAEADIELTGCADCGPVCGDSCGDACGVGGLGLTAGMGGGRRTQVFIGGEWMSMRANFSEATAYREVDLLNDLETFHQFNFDYEDSYGVYGGIRVPECGGEIRFAYRNFSSGGGFVSPANPDVSTDFREFFAPWELALEPGDVLVGEADVDVDNYDIGYSRTIPLGGCCPSSCGDCCDPCGDCCDPCCAPCCPAWDITWSGGIRFADVSSALSWNTIRAGTSPPRSALSTVDFEGVGLRFGLLGRRYIGKRGLVSAYVRGDISLLLGDVEHTVTADPAFTDVTISSTEVVPVTEIEAGITTYLTRNFQVSAGYFLSAWHDLGHRAEYIYAGSPTQVYSMDDANMMTFDGIFVRGEAAF